MNQTFQSFQREFNFPKVYKRKISADLLTPRMRQPLEYNEVDEDFIFMPVSLSVFQRITLSNALISHSITFTKTASQYSTLY